MPLPDEHAMTQANVPNHEQQGDRPDTGFINKDTRSSPPLKPASGSVHAWVGRSLGKYQITGTLGQGGMGVVLKARDPLIERDVAIKVLADELARDETALARFLAEARAAGKLNHANVCGIYEVCREGDTYFLVLEQITGGSLEEWLDKNGPCSVLDATTAMIDACKGIAAAHAVGLIHRDIKPANFLRAADGSIKVTDFGLAKATDGQARHLTQTGLVVGTPYFMSPEQCEAKPVDARTDVYALGATYYCLLTACYPYHTSESVPQIMYNHCFGPILNPRDVIGTTPEACSRIVARAMAKSPAARYQTVDELLVDLQALAATLSGKAMVLPSESGHRASLAAVGRPSPSRSRLLPILAISGAVLSLILAVLIWQLTKHPQAAGGVPIAAGEPIKVGVLHSMSGTMSTSANVVVDATLFAIEEINRAGGVLGRPVKAVVADGRSDLPTFAREAERLISEEKVCSVFGCWTSASRKTVAPIFEKHNHLLLYPLQYEGLESSPCIVYFGAAPNQQIVPAVTWAVNTLKKKSFYLVGSDYVFPRAANAIIKDHLQSLGARLAGEAYLPLGSADAQGVVSELVKAKPDIILNTINGDSNTAFFRALRHAGVTSAAVPTLSFSIDEQGLRNLNSADVVGDYAAWTYFQSVDSAENKEFVRRFRDKFPQRSVTDPMEAAYVSVHLWARAATEAQSLEPKLIRRALLNQTMQAPEGEVRIDAYTQHCYKTPRIGQIQPDGQFKIVWTAAKPELPDPYPDTRSTSEWHELLTDLYNGWGRQWAAPEEGLKR